MMNSERLQNLSMTSVLSAYEGKKEGCRCGCLGKYYYTAENRAAASTDRGYAVSDEEVSDAKVLSILRRIQAIAAEGVRAIDYDETYVNVTLKTKVYTVYVRS